MQGARRRRTPSWSIAVIAIASVIYGATLQLDVNGSADRYAEDVGEFQNVIAQWGTAHPTGYPLYSLAGAAFGTVLRAFDVAPTTAASAFSACVAILALLGTYALFRTWRIAPPVAAATTLLLAVAFPFWIHAAIAEVYALLIALIVLMYLIAARWETHRDSRHIYALAFAAGLAVGHHRLALLALPALAIYAGPLIVKAVRERPIRLLATLLSFFAAFLVYLYIPFRVWTGSTWIYGDPGTWDGFWRLVTGREYGWLVRPAADLAVTETALGQAIETLASGLTWPLFTAGAVGLLVAVASRAHRRQAISLGLLALTNVAFSVVYSQAVLLQAALMPAMLAVSLGAGFLAQSIADRGSLARVAVVSALVMGVVAQVLVNAGPVQAITRDPSGRELIEDVVHAGLDRASSRPVVFALWGPDYFALAYAHSVTRELASIDVVDHRADIKALLDDGHDLYVLSPTFYYERRALPWWDRRLGRAFLSSYAAGLVRVSGRPILTEADLPPVASSAPMGESIALRAWHVEPHETDRAWRLALYWQALSPVGRDYSVFVHASDRDVVDGPDAIVAQADSSAPVYGWYPTSRWSPGEIVRDDHVIRAPADRVPKIVSVGMYYQDESGAFHNLGNQVISLPPLR